MERLILLDDAMTHPGEFEESPYLQTRGPRSVMCLPVMRSGKIEALLYVENSLSAGVFTPARRDVLETLVGLAAISLVNAQLFARQEEALRLERRATEELNRLSRMKDEFLANTSHELRTPLNGIIGLAGSLADGAKGPLPDPAVDTLNLLVTSGRRLEALVNDILDFSSLRVGGLDLRPVPVDLRAMVELAAAILGPRAHENGTVIENGVPDSLTVLVDENRMQQILINLLDNAVKFTRAGQVRVEAARKVPESKSRSPTPASASPGNTATGSSSPSSSLTLPSRANTGGQVWASPSCASWSNCMAARSGWPIPTARERAWSSTWPTPTSPCRSRAMW